MDRCDALVPISLFVTVSSESFVCVRVNRVDRLGAGWMDQDGAVEEVGTDG
jgi:hypothetical protein